MYSGKRMISRDRTPDSYRLTSNGMTVYCLQIVP